MVADVNGMKQSVAKISDAEAEQLRRQLDVKGVMILYVGQLIPRKGVKELLSAWSSVADKNNATLVYVGGGEQEQDLRKQISEENISNVILTGAIDYEQIAIYYKAADCFIIPTTEDNWSLVVPEAMACGLPVACSKYNGCYPELIQPGNGWVFDCFDQEDTKKTICRIIDNKDRLSLMGEESRKIVSVHTAERAAQSIMDAIEIAKKRCGK